MKILLIFLAGMLTEKFFLPIIEGCRLFIINRFNLDATKIQVEIDKLSGENKELQPNIGFQYNGEEEIYYDDEEEETKEDKIGFKNK